MKIDFLLSQKHKSARRMRIADLFPLIFTSFPFRHFYSNPEQQMSLTLANVASKECCLLHAVKVKASNKLNELLYCHLKTWISRICHLFCLGSEFIKILHCTQHILEFWVKSLAKVILTSSALSVSIQFKVLISDFLRKCANLRKMRKLRVLTANLRWFWLRSTSCVFKITS